MVDAAVGFALKEIRVLFSEQGKLLCGVGSAVEALETQLKEMKYLLEDADTRRHQSKTITNWIAEINKEMQESGIKRSIIDHTRELTSAASDNTRKTVTDVLRNEAGWLTSRRDKLLGVAVLRLLVSPRIVFRTLALTVVSTIVPAPLIPIVINDSRLGLVMKAPPIPPVRNLWRILSIREQERRWFSPWLSCAAMLVSIVGREIM
ncbi:hypothetical protein SASPL_112446 [Salvia splendens]|uniref:Disease resistance N-terminal domain-containing protein n=1 Tax=Salvia splendens TaxID=180675 RepID=A0A8X8YDW6_SALSN|nr:hypothetical protein SASPL_112446 [Salvia splendens]